MDDDLRKSLENLEQRQKETLAVLEKSAKQKKTFWDYVQPTVLAALITGLLTYNIQSQQNRVQQLNAVEKFMPYLTAGMRDIDKQQVAVAAVASLVGDEFAIRLAARVPTPGAVLAVDGYFSAVPIDRASISVTPPPPASVSGKEGWAYLGDFDDSKNVWGRRYFQFADSAAPDSLVGQKLEVATTPLNVRQGMPAPDASFPAVIDVLRPGSKVAILEVRPWQSTGFMWARISYVPGKE